MTAMANITPDSGDVDPSFAPKNADDLAKCLASWRWRIFSGRIYKIKTKESEGETSNLVVPFIPNISQRDLLNRLNNRNLILKARQLGFSTLIEILAFDHCLFNNNQTALIISHTADDAEVLFRDKIKFAYDSLPKFLRDRIRLEKETQSQLIFDNGSSLRVTTSGRGGTAQFLHISELGKIAARYPDKAREITTGALQTVPQNGLVFIESTAEGKSGVFYDLAKKAQEKAQAEKPITPMDYKFHFYPWWREDKYRLDPEGVRISAKEHEYFDDVEGIMDCVIDLDQRAWYIKKRDEEFITEPALMWREYPSTPEECWQSSTDGKYLVHVMAHARREGRITTVPLLRHVPVNSFWDLGASDDTVVWLHQKVGAMDHWVGCREASGEGLLPFLLWMEQKECVWGGHYLPHDASNAKQGIEDVRSTISQLREIKPSWNWHVVPRVRSIQHGIDLMRNDFQTYVFDETACKEGLVHLENYSRDWNTRLQTWSDQPRHDDHSHAADALRQKAQAFEVFSDTKVKKKRLRRTTGMTA